MADFITRCPQCTTAFRVGDAVLAAARGLVRCGKCQKVFKASDHEIIHNPPPAEFDDLDDDMLFADDPAEIAAAEAYIAEQRRAREANSEFTPGTDDESWALALLDEANDEPDYELRKVVEPERDSEDRAPWAPAGAPGHYTPINFLREQTAAEQQAEAQAQPLVGPPRPPRRPPRLPPTLSAAREVDAEQVQAMIEALAPEAMELQLAAAEQRPPPSRRRLWWSALIGGALLIIIQIAWLSYDRLNTRQPYRALYAVACTVLPCDLPELRDLRAIKTGNLVVRTHPQEPDRLAVDVVLTNRAAFEQRFPTLVLTFRDARDQPVTTLRFAPDQYLAGELAGRPRMPVNTPVRIALTTPDPGDRAVGYSIAIEQ